MVAFATRGPTDDELENFRLALSLVNHGIGAYNGGVGGIPISPHWGWVERAYAAAFNGILVPGSKAAFDVLCPCEQRQNTYIGIQVKTDGKWRDGNNSRCLIEYNNENSRYNRFLKQHNIDLDTSSSLLTGRAINAALQSYHDDAPEKHNIPDGFTIDLENSVIVHITWRWQNGGHGKPENNNDRYQFQMHSFNHQVQVNCWAWNYERKALIGYESTNFRSRVADKTGRERARGAVPNAYAYWTAGSRGQLKIYPLRLSANYSVDNWQTLEEGLDLEYIRDIVGRARELFPEDE